MAETGSNSRAPTTNPVHEQVSESKRNTIERVQAYKGDKNNLAKEITQEDFRKMEAELPNSPEKKAFLDKLKNKKFSTDDFDAKDNAEAVDPKKVENTGLIGAIKNKLGIGASTATAEIETADSYDEDEKTEAEDKATPKEGKGASAAKGVAAAEATKEKIQGKSEEEILAEADNTKIIVENSQINGRAGIDVSTNNDGDAEVTISLAKKPTETQIKTIGTEAKLEERTGVYNKETEELLHDIGMGLNSSTNGAPLSGHENRLIQNDVIYSPKAGINIPAHMKGALRDRLLTPASQERTEPTEEWSSGNWVAKHTLTADGYYDKKTAAKTNDGEMTPAQVAELLRMKEEAHGGRNTKEEEARFNRTG